MAIKKLRNSIFYVLKPLIPRWFQLWLRRQMVIRQRKQCKNIWPILESAKSRPDGWIGWPDGKRFAVVLTHDVELQSGHDKCLKVMELENKLNFKSSFNFVPERYRVSAELRNTLVAAGFEVGVHGLNHDGKLFRSKKIFDSRYPRINSYLKEWKSVGFRAPAMHHNLDWIKSLKIHYDLSTFDTDPFEPQSDGVGTIFPFWVAVDDTSDGNGYLEMPYTLAQDFTPFVLMREQTIDIWTKKVDWIAKNGGMVLVNTHPDYFWFEDEKRTLEQFPSDFYRQLLVYLRNNYRGQYWHVLPKEMAEFWSANMLNRINS